MTEERHYISFELQAREILGVVLLTLVITDNGELREIAVGTLQKEIFEDDIFRQKISDAVLDLTVRKLRAEGHEVNSIEIQKKREAVH